MSESNKEESETKMKIPDGCGECRFFKRTFSGGECHRYPPLTQVSRGRFGAQEDTSWPLVDARDWCGEFKRKEEVVSNG